jgi:hypothetical protein
MLPEPLSSPTPSPSGLALPPIPVLGCQHSPGKKGTLFTVYKRVGKARKRRGQLLWFWLCWDRGTLGKGFALSEP